jgi:peptidoglycan/xylan/chitin deacetylase (PgdA/CDA1 family)
MDRLIKQIITTAANSAVFERMIWLLNQADAERENIFRVLTYHRIAEPGPNLYFDPGLISASPEAFESHMKYLAANHEVVSMLDAVKAFESGREMALPVRAVIITFDDAYRDFAEYAWPVLKHYRIPVTLFVPTAFPDHPERTFWWDRLFDAIDKTERGEIQTSIGRLLISTNLQRERAYKRLKNHIKTLPAEVAMNEVEHICEELGDFPHENDVLGWDSLRQLSKEGVILGAHTRTHPIMNSVTRDEMVKEAIGSRQDLQRETGLVSKIFAYPSGIHNQDAVKSVEEAGFSLAFTTEPGTNDVRHADRLRLRRINVGIQTTIPILQAKFLYSRFLSNRSMPSPVKSY